MAQTSDRVAAKYGVTREEQDEYALESQKRAAAAWQACRISEEVAPIEVRAGRKTIRVERDDHMRPETTLEALAALPASFGKGGQVTAGNASGIVDGAAAVVVTSADTARERGKKPLGRIVSWGVAGVEPELMGLGPAPAARQALAKAGLSIADVDLWEINEAFAGQILGVIRELGLDREKLNVNGGAIALGHPLAATGTRCSVRPGAGLVTADPRVSRPDGRGRRVPERAQGEAGGRSERRARHVERRPALSARPSPLGIERMGRRGAALPADGASRTLLPSGNRFARVLRRRSG
jgi:acetyl-CoA acetyltransferase family protein